MTSSSDISAAERLIDIQAECIGVGTIFVFPVYDFRAGEKYAELMLFQSSAEGALFEFLPVSGYDSGKRFGSFVLESYISTASRDNVNTEWLKNNWNRVVYQESKLSEVYVFRRHSPKKFPPVAE